MVKAFLEVFVLLGCLVFCCHSKPTGGIFKESIYSVNTSNEAKVRIKPLLQLIVRHADMDKCLCTLHSSQHNTCLPPELNS